MQMRWGPTVITRPIFLAEEAPSLEGLNRSSLGKFSEYIDSVIVFL